MICYIYSNTRFEKMLAAMRISEKMAVAATKKADKIIQNIRTNGGIPLSEQGKFTRH